MPNNLKKVLFGMVTTISFSTTSTIATTLSPANASTPIVKQIKRSQASGVTGTLHTIKVWKGHGVSISFYNTGETIKRVWIDDPSQILLDSDGCLQGINQDCETNGAGLLHLRRINRLNIRGLPKTWATHLTIITESAAGRRKSYHFRIVPANNNPQYSQIAIIPDFKPRPRTKTRTRTGIKPGTETKNGTETKLITESRARTETKSKQRINITSISRGINKALKQGLVTTNDELYRRVSKLIYTLENEEQNLQLAAKKVGVSMRLIRKLQQLGN